MTNTKLWQCRKVHQVYNIIEPCYNTGQVHYSDPDCNSLLPIRADNSKIMYSVTCRIHSRLGQGCCWQHWSWPTWPCPTERPQTDPLHLSCRPTTTKWTKWTRMNKNEQENWNKTCFEQVSWLRDRTLRLHKRFRLDWWFWGIIKRQWDPNS